MQPIKPTLPSPMIRTLQILGLSAAACFALGFTPINASAQTSDGTSKVSGDFKFSDGDKGTFVRTITETTTGSTETTVFTRRSDDATSTDSRTDTKNTDGTRTVTVSAQDFGATTAFTSTRVVTPEKHGDASGTGTFTDATGVSGTFTTLESSLGNISTVDATYTSAAGVTTELRLTDDELRLREHKIVTRAPDGTVTAEVRSIFVTHFGK